MQRFQCDVSFTCPRCSAHNNIAVGIPEPDWTGVEDAGNLNSEGYIYIECTNCAGMNGAHVQNNGGNVEIITTTGPTFPIQAGPAHFSEDEYDDWPEPLPSSEPADVFYALTEEISALFTNHGSDDGSALINRMLFSSLITALESYLSDTLLLMIEERPDALSNLLNREKDLVTKKFSLAEIQGKPSLVKDTATGHLREIMYHNLPKVNAIYKAALDVDFVNSTIKKDFADLNEAIQNRHHCVHRNGKDQDGNILAIFTQPYFVRTRTLVIDLVGRIEAQLFPA